MEAILYILFLLDEEKIWVVVEKSAVIWSFIFYQDWHRITNSFLFDKNLDKLSIFY